MRRRYYPFFLATFLFNICVFGQEEVGKSNVLLIVIDDLGWRDLGCYGSSFHETSYIDALAKDGILFTDAYATSPVCSPSRSSILTGKYTTETGLTDFIGPAVVKDPAWWHYKLIPPVYDAQLNKGLVNISEVLSLNNYNSYYVGKWHLGGDEFYPEKQGFDKNIGGYSSGKPKSYFPPFKNPNLPDKPDDKHLTTRLTNETKKIITEHLENNTDQPFFIALNYYAVHSPIQAPKSKVKKYKNKLANNATDGKVWGKLKGNNTRLKQNHPTYAAMVETVDKSIGNLIEFISDIGIDENTLIIITSDNGGLSTRANAPKVDIV